MLSYLEILELVNTGVIENVGSLDQVNGASLDIILGDTLKEETIPPSVCPMCGHESTSFSHIQNTMLFKPCTSGAVETCIECEYEGSPMEWVKPVDLANKETLQMREVSCEEGYVLNPGCVVLGHSKEVFNLPRDIAAVYALKSSQARSFLDHALAGFCFTGDTKIPLLDGTEVPIEQLVGREDVWVYSLDRHGEFVPSLARDIRQTRVVSSLVSVLLDNGEQFTCTPDHLIMQRDGSYTEAEDLIEGDSLMPLYRRSTKSGHEQVYSPSTRRKSNWKRYKGKWVTTHREVYQHAYGEVETGLCVHHVDEVKTNNTPGNLESMQSGEHFSMHTVARNKSQRQRQIASVTMKVTINEIWADPEFRARHVARSKVQADGWNKRLWTDPEHIAKMRKVGKANEGNILNADKAMVQRKGKLGSVKTTLRLLEQEGLPVTEGNYLLCKKQNAPTVATLVRVFGSFKEALAQAGYRNHKVVEVSAIQLDEPVPVYDMTIPKHHNFAIASGVFVHNCDPGWHGATLTLEFKNVSQHHPLLLKSGMKCGQMRFHRLAVPVPEDKSYAVRGQYNHQTGATESKGIR